MKQTFRREHRLPAFLIDVGDLKLLRDKILPLLPAETKFTLGFALEGREVKLDSLEEIEALPDLPDTIKGFTISASHWEQDKSFRLSARHDSLFASSVAAEGPDEAWCAGVVEVARTFFNSRKRWYATIRGWPLNLIILIPWLYIVADLKYDVIPKDVPASLRMSLSITLFLLFVMWMQKGKILPTSTLIIRQPKYGWRNFVPELTAALAVITLIFTIVQTVVALKALPEAQQTPPAHPTVAPPVPPAAPPPKAPASK